MRRLFQVLSNMDAQAWRTLLVSFVLFGGVGLVFLFGAQVLGFDGEATVETWLGAASGAVAGLVAITPACGFVDPWAALLLGITAGGVCAYAVGLKYRAGFDDSLDVVGVHLVGGALGAVSLGIIARYPFAPGQHQGLIYSGPISQLGVQLLGPVAVGLYSFVAAWIIGKVIDRTMGFRITRENEVTGVDITTHAETGYDLGTVHASGVAPISGPVTVRGAQAAVSGEKKVDV